MKRFDRTKTLIGNASFEILSKSSVAVFGLGGVGSYTVEALVRSGIEKLYIFDCDRVDITNINRQIIATESTVGMLKTDAAEQRIKDINPNATVVKNNEFLTAEIIGEMDFSKFDYVVDAVDNISAKIAICNSAFQNKIPVISAMGAGNRLLADFEIATIEKTSGCHLARIMRKELGIRKISGVKACFSKSAAIDTDTKEVRNALGRPAPASISFVPSVMGLMIAGEVVRDLIKYKI